MRTADWKWILLLLFSGGCRAGHHDLTERQPVPQRPVQAAAESPAALPRRAAFDTSKGYLHKSSGVGFVYPAGWEREEATGEETDTSLGLRKSGVGLVTLFWTDIGAVPVDIGSLKHSELREIYHEKVSGPKPLTIAGQAGFEIPIHSGTMGDESSLHVGADYVFTIRRWPRTWMIECRASAPNAKALEKIKLLLANYRVTVDGEQH